MDPGRDQVRLIDKHVLVEYYPPKLFLRLFCFVCFCGSYCPNSMYAKCSCEFEICLETFENYLLLELEKEPSPS